jgi:hemin uptake protein HemP
MSASRPAHEPDAVPPRASVGPASISGKPPATSSARRWRSAELFGPEQEVEIEHGQSVYRLRLTSLGKLILTK